MPNSTRELWLAFIAVIVITAFYLFIAITLGGIPAASEFFGHSIGILGFSLMLMTETLYTLRKRSRSARWGRMSSWLQFHIFTGLVGPYMVLLHSSWKFNGLAGIVTLMTAIVVISGFIGRYIYTAVPRTAEGIEMEAGELQKLIEALELEVKGWLAKRPEAAAGLSPLLAAETLDSQATLNIGNPFTQLSGRLQGWFARQQLEPATRAQVNQLEDLLKRRQVLRRQVASLARARRLLAVWHAVHIPLGMALFTAAFIHIGAAIYYATLLR
jgi:hypothetical protein